MRGRTPNATANGCETESRRRDRRREGEGGDARDLVVVDGRDRRVFVYGCVGKVEVEAGDTLQNGLRDERVGVRADHDVRLCQLVVSEKIQTWVTSRGAPTIFFHIGNHPPSRKSFSML